MCRDLDAAGALHGKHVLVTRARDQARSLLDLLEQRGAIPIHVPAIEFRRIDSAEIADVCERLQQFDWLVLTSQITARLFVEALIRLGYDVEAKLRDVQIAAVGRSTAAVMRDLGGQVDLIPRVETGASLARELLDQEGLKRVLVPGSSIARPELTTVLRNNGVDVIQITLYETVCPSTAPQEAIQLLNSGRFDVATFTSPSTVRNTCRLIGVDLLRVPRIVTIGSTTTAAVRECGLDVAEEARAASMEELVAAAARACR